MLLTLGQLETPPPLAQLMTTPSKNRALQKTAHRQPPMRTELPHPVMMTIVIVLTLSHFTFRPVNPPNLVL